MAPPSAYLACVRELSCACVYSCVRANLTIACMRGLLRQDLGELCALPNLHDLNVSFNALRSLAGLGRRTTPAGAYTRPLFGST